MSTFGDTGSGDALQLLQLVMQMKQRRQQVAQQHLSNSLELAQPGTTYGQLGLSEKDLKRALGRAPAPDEIAKALTPQEIMRKKGIDFLNSASPETVNTLVATTAATSAGAPSGLYTAKGIADTAGANAATAKTQRKIAETTGASQVKAAQIGAANEQKKAQTLGQAIDEGMKSWNTFDSSTKSLLGQRALFGQTQSEVQGSEVNTLLKTQIQKEALKSTLDPAHPANKFWRQIGVDPATGIAMIGLGAENLIDTRFRMLATLQTQHGEQETALQKADASVAAEIGKKLGASATTVLRELHNMDAGKAPNSPLGQQLQMGIEMNYKAAINQAAVTGDPTIQQLGDLLQGALKMVGHNDELKAYSKVVALKTAETIMRQRGIDRPLDPAQLDQYNIEVSKIANQLSTFGKKGDHWWSSFGFLTPQTQQADMIVQSPNSSKQDTLNMSKVDPQAAAAVQQFLGALGMNPAQNAPAGVPPAPQLQIPGLNPQKP